MGDDGDLRMASGEQLTGLARRYYGLERNAGEPDSELRGRCLALVHTDRVNTARKEGADMDDIGRIAYVAYAKHTGGETYDGRDMPKWEDLGERIQGAWRAAVQAIINL